MAIDSAEKRKSAAVIVLPFPPGVTPNASKDTEWRAEAGWAYAGIPPGEAVVVEPTVDKGRDAGSGRLQYVDPYEIYGQKRKTAKAAKRHLGKRAEESGKRLVEIEKRAAGEQTAVISRELGELRRAVEGLDTAVRATEVYELLAIKAAEIERRLAWVERLLREDDELMALMALML